MTTPDSSVKKKPERTKIDPRSVTLDSLPPCKVCDSVASGLHYGAVSCEACKSFFRRSFGTSRKYKCRSKAAHGECKISSQMKCAFCRLQKCHEIGMSREAMKVGRYTHAQRTLNIVQMKHHKDGVKSRQCWSPTTRSLCHNGADVPILPHSQHSDESDFSADERMAYLADMNEQSCLIKAIVEANEKHNAMFDKLKDEKDVSERILHHYNECMLEDRLYGPRYAPTWQEFDRFYKATGMQMDNRVEDATVTVQQMDQLAKGAIKFAKAIPGFKDITIKDQATLIKGGFFEFWNICVYRGVNPDLRIAIFLDGNAFRVDEMSWPGERVYIGKLMEFSKRLQNLQITKEEDALLQAIVLTSPDRAELEQADLVSKLHWNIVWSLWNLLPQNHESPNQKFCKIIDCLVEFRELTAYDREFTLNLPFDIPEIHTSELVCELGDCPCMNVNREPS